MFDWLDLVSLADELGTIDWAGLTSEIPLDSGLNVASMLDPDILTAIDWGALDDIIGVDFDPSLITEPLGSEPFIPTGIDVDPYDPTAPDTWDPALVSEPTGGIDVDPYDPNAPDAGTGSSAGGSSLGNMLKGGAGASKLLMDAAKAIGGAMLGGGGGGGAGGGGSLFGAIQPQGIPSIPVPSGGPIGLPGFPMPSAGPSLGGSGFSAPSLGGSGFSVPEMERAELMAAPFAPLAPIQMAALPDPGQIAPFQPMTAAVPLPQMMTQSAALPRPQPLTGLQRLMMEA